MKVCKNNKDSMQNKRNKNSNWKFDLAWNLEHLEHLICQTKLDFGNLIINESKSSGQFPKKNAYHPILKYT